MKFSPLARSISLGSLAIALSIPMAAQAAFIEDSKASLELRNFYMNRDFRDAPSGSQSKAEEWAQGFLLRYESGFTEGTVGVGVDAYGFSGFKLDSGGGTSGTGLLLPKNHKGKVPSSYGSLGGTFKARLSENTLKAGTLMPKIPTVSSGDGRLIPQTFTGVHINSQEIENLTANIGRLGRMKQRNSTNDAPILLNGFSGNQGKRKNKSTRSNPTETSKFDFAGVNYNWGDTGLSTGYNFANFDGAYKQHIVNGVYTLAIDDNQSLKADLRYAKTSEDAKSGIDNKAISSMLTYSLGHSSFGLGYQKMSGDTGYAYIELTDPFLTNYVQIRDFAATDEKSWQARYDYNFAGLGIPGLNLMTRYIRGNNIYMGAGQSRGKEWERDTDISYVIQEGPLKNLGIKWRNATLRSDLSGKIDENRLIVNYTIPLM
ncbi:OprD family porin [Denitrificimonas caeni]|uniref:OprD family porin n=1 Tax=Denitrificimonas caeni TaxID=521720 RepID=A0AAF0AIG5_9GAMM|nr:OprD family porin [Denitrificimonas caeni]WBE24415.1 OprD family porin [Denitrificimonas caeni]